MSDSGCVTEAFHVLCMCRKMLLYWKTNRHVGPLRAVPYIQKRCAESKKRKHAGEMKVYVSSVRVGISFSEVN